MKLATLLFSVQVLGRCWFTNAFLRAGNSESFERELSSCGGWDQSCCSTSPSDRQCYDRNKVACDASSSCTACGGKNEQCCDSADGPTCDASFYFCNANNICEKCGWWGSKCCPQPDGSLGCLDKKHHICNLTSTECESCGDIGQFCCDSDKPCDSLFATCDPSTNKCVSCGANNEDCCEDSLGNPFCEDNIRRRCVGHENWLGGAPGTCMNCGGEGEPCCVHQGAPTCESSYLFCNATSDLCQDCGGTNEPCCPSGDTSMVGTCKDPGYTTCFPDGVGGGVCRSCGGTGQPCCDAGSCDSHFGVCNSTSYCEECGKKEGQPCCDGDTCRDTGNLSCNTTSAQCEKCGGPGELICTGLGIRKCDTEYAYELNGICHPCGADGEECCPGNNECQKTGSACIPNMDICHPLHLHPSASPSAVPSSSPSSSPSETPTISAAPSAVPSATPSFQPSVSPSSSPTLSMVPTNTPSLSMSPTLILYIDFPNVMDTWETIAPSILTIAKSDAGVLGRIVLVNGDDWVPVVRSYDGGEWHPYAGTFAGMSVTCTPTDCSFELDDPVEGVYKLGATRGYTLTNDEVAARFFESTTFGMPISGITALSSQLLASSRRLSSSSNSEDPTFASWVSNQMDESVTPMTSLRQFYRMRTNGKNMIRKPEVHAKLIPHRVTCLVAGAKQVYLKDQLILAA